MASHPSASPVIRRRAARSGVFAVALLAVLAGVPASARYLEPAQVDLVHILAPPPQPSSPAGRADLDAVLAAQQARTPAEVKNAQADDEISVFRFADVLGADFTAAKLPVTGALFKTVWADANAAITGAKDHFDRPRPTVADRRVEPVIKAANASYPSGAATFAAVTAILLADMVPEQAPALFARGAAFARNRVVAGVHYPTDIEGGGIAGAVIANVLLHDPAFLAEFAKARAELRHGIGLQ